MSGIYSAAAGMAAQQTWLDAISNDIANVNTPGYQKQRVAFDELDYSGDGFGAGAAATTIGPSQQQGPLEQTGDPLSLAIEGSGYFRVTQPDGTVALTRDGQFQLDANGAITNEAGDRLSPPVTVPKGTQPSAIAVAADGTITVAGAQVGKLAISTVPVPGSLLAVGNGLYAPTQASGQPIAATGLVRQGYVEQSNVDLADAMVAMMQAQRAYQLASKAVQTQDQLASIANGIRQ